MKAKTLMGMIACAGACVSLSAFGNNTNDWFSVGVANNAIDPVNCSTNGVAVSIENSKIVLDNEYTTRLAITPAVVLSSTNSTDVAKIDVTALLTPSSTNDLAVIDDAKAGFAVGIDDQNQTNYYGYASGEWHKLTGGNPEKDGDTTFSIIINYRDSVVDFVADGVDLTPTPLSIAANSSFTGIDAFGSGSITSVDSKFEVAVAAATVGGVVKKFGSAVEALAAADENTTIKDVSATGEAAAQPQAANGLYAWECDALNIAENATIPLTPAASDNDVNNVTLAVSGVTPDTGVSVTYSVYQDGVVEPVSTGNAASAIKIPVGTGKFTIKPVVTAAQ